MHIIFISLLDIRRHFLLAFKVNISAVTGAGPWSTPLMSLCYTVRVILIKITLISFFKQLDVYYFNATTRNCTKLRYV